PSSWRPPATFKKGDTGVAGWSMQAQLLPYLEQKATHSEVDYNLPYNDDTLVVETADGQPDVRISALRVPTYLCPSEVRDEVRLDGSGNPNHYPLNYAVNLGVWFVWDPNTLKGGDGAFYPNSKLTAGDFLDGQSYTMALAEVKAWGTYFRDSGETNPAMPTAPADICNVSGGNLAVGTGHTEWVDGRGNQTGFTTVFPPNAKIVCSTVNAVEVDWITQREG